MEDDLWRVCHVCRTYCPPGYDFEDCCGVRMQTFTSQVGALGELSALYDGGWTMIDGRRYKKEGNVGFKIFPRQDLRSFAKKFTCPCGCGRPEGPMDVRADCVASVVWFTFPCTAQGELYFEEDLEQWTLLVDLV